MDHADRHLRIGWTALAIFISLGMALEALHAFKVGAYLDVDNSTRRFMWTLAHSHGTLLGLVNLAFAVTLPRIPMSAGRLAWVSPMLTGATVLMPAGFFLGGMSFHGGDPGLGVLLVPIGGAMLVAALVAVVLTLRATRSR